MNNNKSKHYDMIKVFATILVVVAHATRMYSGKGVFKPVVDAVGLKIITEIIYSFHMPLYMCVSGMVYGYCIDTLNKYSDTIGFVKNKAIRLLIPYYAFGVFYVAPVMIILNLTNESYVSYCVNDIILGLNSRHLWFVFALFIIFVICAMAKTIIQKVNPLIILPILVIVSYISGFLPGYFALNNVFYYLLFFYLGYVFNKYYEVIIKYLKHPVVLISITILLVIILPYENWPFRVAKAMFGSGIMFGVIQYVNIKICDTRFFKELKGSAYGVYFFHPMIIYTLFYIFHKYSINPYLLCGFIIIITYVLSYLLTWLIRKIKLGFLIGE